MKRRQFIRNTLSFSSATLLSPVALANSKRRKLRSAHIGVGGMGASDLQAISSHPQIEVIALCDVDSNHLAAAKKLHPGASVFTDYRRLFDELANSIDAVIVTTPDHTHAPASFLAMEMGKPVYCQKPLAHNVSEVRVMKKMAKEKNLVTQMGIQCHSFDEYRTAVMIIQSGIIGKVSCVRAWSTRNWGFDGPVPAGSDPVPGNLDWNLWLGTATDRPFKEKIYHPDNWRKVLDFGCGTLGDMGVHIFDTPFTALELDVPLTVRVSCRRPNGYWYPENNVVRYKFRETRYTTRNLKWVWYDGPGAPEEHKDLKLPDNEKLPGQGAMFVGEKGRLLLPHWVYPKLIVDGKYEKIDFPDIEPADHYHQFVDACLGNDTCSAPFSYAAGLSETILLGVVANSFPNKSLHWNKETARFSEEEANSLLKSDYRDF